MVKVTDIKTFQSGVVVLFKIKGIEELFDIMLKREEVLDILSKGKTVKEYVEELSVVM